jgi:hypothetical protein
MDEDPIRQHQTLVIVMRRIALAACALTFVAGCATPSNGPNGWRPIAGANNAWVLGTDGAMQEYRYDATSFGGGLQDLASQVAVDGLTRYHGAHFTSRPFAPCPGSAGVATFALRNRMTLQEAFAVHDGRAIRIRYLRPAGAPVDRNAFDAMQRTLCKL